MKRREFLSGLRPAAVLRKGRHRDEALANSPAAQNPPNIVFLLTDSSAGMLWAC